MKPYYQDPWVTLYLGDCLEIDAWLAADVLVTDPPYGIGWISGKFAASRDVRAAAEAARRNGDISITGDASTEARDAVLALWGGRPAMVFGTWRSDRPTGTQHRLIWYKAKTYQGARASTAPWFPADEEIYVLGAGFVGTPEQNVYVSQRMMAASHGLVAEVGHPTPKPVGLMSSLITKCPPGIIADPFAGSGSTLVAAKALGRKSIGVELDERYAEIAARRLSQDVLDFEEWVVKS